ncbi:MAG TPA: serine/threonine-protein kinase, partial [Anaerolineae bacterium]|nr:serine/threonine-protein kinase [Anaerolineae bacterium]
MANLLNSKYQLQELISQSERNLVYKAYEPARSRLVAIKYLSPAPSGDQTAVLQFRQEMQLIAGLNHRNILSVYDYGLEEDRLYLVTPYIAGAALQERIGEFGSLARASQLSQSLAQALVHVHDQGIIHGNLKPSNILLDEAGQPLLTDFGAFQKIGVHGLGSPYQSPEQAQGGPIDARTDVYALGVLLYEMLIGQPPPKGASLSPHLQRPDLTLEVEQVILTAMAEDPAQRYQSVGQFCQALTAAISAEVPPTTPATDKPGGQAIPWWGYALAGVVIVAIIGILVFSLFGRGDSGSSGGSTIIIGGGII